MNYSKEYLKFKEDAACATNLAKEFITSIHQVSESVEKEINK